MRFKRVYIEISNICNLNCSFCAPLKREKRSMSQSEFEHVIKEIFPYTDYVYFHIKGEPLMHPELAYFFDLCEAYHLKVNLTTNGTLLKQMRSLLLSKAALRQVNFSLHSFPAHHDINFDEYLHQILDFSADFSHKKGFSLLRMWNLNENRDIDEFSKKIILKIGDYFHFESDLLALMSSRRSVTLVPGIFLGWEQEFQWPSLSLPLLSSDGICYGMRTMVGILADGTVVPCCLDANGEAALGNLFQTPFLQIIQGERAKNIQENFYNRRVVEPLCLHCSYRLRFS